MGLFNNIRKIIGRHVGFLLFLFLFILYFSSSVGVMNSIDAPQYFTTEAIIRHHTLDMGSFKNDPHYFIAPDFANINGNILNLHGFMLSIIAIPVHLISLAAKNLFSLKSFNPSVVTEHFSYELSVASFYTLFSVGGLMFVWKAMVKIIRKKLIPTLMTFFLGAGSSIWKWSATYQRQGIILLILGIAIYLLTDSYLNRKDKHYWIWCLLLVVSYGVDMFLFLSLFSFFILTVLYLYAEQGDIHILDIKKAVQPFIALVVYIIFLSFLSYKIYGFIQPFQSIYREADNPYYTAFFEGKSPEEKYRVLMSAPVLNTLPAVLFNVGKLPPKSYTHISSMSENVKVETSYYYLDKYNFFGLFVISPFLLFSAFVFFRKKKYKLITLFGFWIFIVNIILQSIFIVFWGGTQYDVRYFYPYIICLAIPTALVITSVSEDKKPFLKYMVLSFFVMLGLFSFLMGWLGVLSMYKPALTGERRIWIDVLTFLSKYKSHSLMEYINATFPNRENAWIPAVLSAAMYSLWLLGRYLHVRNDPRK